MQLPFFDRVAETSTTTGTGSFTLLGAILGYQSFATVGNGTSSVPYCVSDSSGNFEVGLGTYSTTGPQLSRDTVLTSSNGNALVNFAAGTKNVFLTVPATLLNQIGSSGWIGSGQLANYSVNSININSGAVTNATIASGAVMNSNIANGAIMSGQIASGQIGTYHLSPGLVIPVDLTSGAVTSGDIGNGAVVSGSIASGQIGLAHLASGTIPATFSLTSGVVQSGNIGNASVNANNYASGSVGLNALASGIGIINSGSITSGDLGNASVVSGSIASGAVGTNALASGTALGNIASGTITQNYLASGLGGGGGFSLGSGSIQSGMIALGAVTSGDIASGAFATSQITSGLIASGAVGQYALSSGTAISNIQSGSITATMLASGVAGGGGGSVTSGSITGYDIASGAIQQLNIANDLSVAWAGSVAPFNQPWGNNITNTVVTAGELFSGSDYAVCFNQSGNVIRAMASVSGRMPAVGWTNTGPYASGSQMQVYVIGVGQTAQSFSGQFSQPVYVGRSGNLVTASGSFNSGGFQSGDIIQQMGVAFASGSFMLNVCPAFQAASGSYI